MGEVEHIVRDIGKGQSAGPPGFGAEPILIHEPGGDVLRSLLHPSWTVFERLFRVLPEEAWFTIASTQRPVFWEFGTYVVPSGMQAWIYDYQFLPFLPSGVDPFGMTPAPDFGNGQMGFDIHVGGKRIADMLYQLDPSAVQFERTSFQSRTQGGRAQQAQFNTSAANAFASVSGQGLSLLPVREAVQGPRARPWTWIVPEGQRISLVGVIFRPIGVPIACIQAGVSGYISPMNTATALVHRLRPR